MPLEARIGSFKVQNIKFDFLPDGTSVQEQIEVPIREVDLSKDEDEAKLFPIYGPETRGLYTVVDFS